MIHKLFMSLFVAYLVANIILAVQTGNVSGLVFGVFTGALISLLVAGVLSAINVLGSGLNATGSWLIFSVSFYLTLLFGVPIPLSQVNKSLSDITLGGNLVGNILTITPFPFNIIILATGIILLIAGIQIIIGGRTGGA